MPTKMQDADPAQVLGYLWLVWDIIKLLIAFSPLLVIATIFITNTESGANRNHRPDFELDPVE